MCCFCFANDVRGRRRGRASAARSFVRPAPIVLRLGLLLAALAGLASRAADTNGPTIQLRFGPEVAAANAVADFMYFVPLISREPVSSLTSPGSTQLVRILSAKRRFSKHSFTVVCEVELTGDGWQQSVFDLAPSIHRLESQLQKDGCLSRRLKSIDVRGAGAITVEVEGAVSNEVATVREVRLRFNAHGHASPVWINMCDLRHVNGAVRPANESLARVNTLTFRRQPGPPTMDVTIASVKHKDAGDGFWQNLKGRLAGTAVNMFLDPFTVEAAGHEAMLDFGQALVSGAPTFTFPRARNLQANNAP
jgi:hypothetical protein